MLLTTIKRKPKLKANERKKKGVHWTKRQQIAFSLLYLPFSRQKKVKEKINQKNNTDANKKIGPLMWLRTEKK